MLHLDLTGEFRMRVERDHGDWMSKKKSTAEVRFTKEIRKSNEALISKKLHKITIPDYSTCIAFPVGKHYNKYAENLPISTYYNSVLNSMISKKYIRWYPFLGTRFVAEKPIKSTQNSSEVLPSKRILYCQEFPMVVIDIDHNSQQEVENAIKSFPFMQQNSYSICPSLSGIGCHIHFRLDLSHIKQDPYVTRFSNEDAYKNGDRYAYIVRFQTWFIEELKKDTGIVACTGSIGGHIAYNPSEIGVINEYWQDKKPIKLPEENTSFVDYQALAEQKRKDRIADTFKPMLDQMYDFFLMWDESLAVYVAQWIVDNANFNKDEEDVNKYYEAGIQLRNKFQSMRQYFIDNFDKIRLFTRKKKDLGLESNNIAFQLFGVNCRRYNTYFRRIIIFMLKLTRVKSYVKKKTVDLFDYMPNMECEWFSSEFLDKHWWSVNGNRISEDPIAAIKQVSSELGNGNTWTALKHYVPLVVTKFGLVEGRNILYAALELSCANDKRSRKKEIERFAQRVWERPYENGVPVRLAA
jgi:hypothetical protein